MSKQLPFYLRHEPNSQNDPAEWLPDFESEMQVAERYAARGRLTFTRNTMSQPAMYWCTQGDPCDSAACPLCMREFRRWWVDAGITLFERRPRDLTAASLVHHTLSRGLGNLASFDLGKAKRQLARHIDRAGLGSLVAIGGFDFSYNQPATGTTPYWQPHAYVLFQGVEQKLLKEALSPFYPATDEIPVPVRTRRVTDLMEALSYAVKAIFYRRTSYRDANGRANTRWLPLQTSAERELLTYLDQLHPADRLFLKSVRRSSSKLTILPSDGNSGHPAASHRKIPGRSPNHRSRYS
jgi:hypothetical protein